MTSLRLWRSFFRVVFIETPTFSMLLVYPKSEQGDLSVDQVKMLRRALEI